MTSPAPHHQHRLDACIERAAEQLGDIHPLVISELYRQHPQAQALFVQHGLGMTASLERSMVDSTLYCVMTWFVRPAEVQEIMSSTTVLHEAMEIPVDLLHGLLKAVLDVIASTIPPDDEESRATLRELQAGLLALA